MDAINKYNREDGQSRKDLLDVGRKLLSLECEALTIAKEQLDDSFLDAVDLLLNCKGKVIITGLGKSGIAGRKIAATFSSTGIPSLFLHSGEAGHGDLGVVANSDVVIALSFSGETRELAELMPRFKFLGVPVIAMTAKCESALGKSADVILDVSIPNYPWPYGLLPTASNSVTVGIGDALAVALLVARGVNERDFASLHPGGLLGQKMLVQVDDHMHTGKAMPVVRETDRMIDVLVEMTAKRLGVACVLDSDDHIAGIVTDGDLRRLLEKETDPLELTARETMTAKPKTIKTGTLSAEALRIMETNSITTLPVVDKSERMIGIVHLHDIIKLERGK